MTNFQIKILPSEWTCDIWVGHDKDKVSEQLSLKYGEGKSYWRGEINGQGTVISPCWSIPDSEYFILLYLEDFTPKIVVHECLHITQHFAKITGMKWGQESQELHALYLEWLFDEIMKRKTE